ncbi:hypothetical protein CDAR_572711 [Caerostris darwini]|uniref:Uncharacterized protein n=1 Tax=Caerostris darwini TaxID=1538125 RepID=A0AAV4VS96_9ARAC|nr:hypothetical protein CDAR_572711 [Caerostris darwini]
MKLPAKDNKLPLIALPACTYISQYRTDIVSEFNSHDKMNVMENTLRNNRASFYESFHLGCLQIPHFSTEGTHWVGGGGLMLAGAPLVACLVILVCKCGIQDNISIQM